MLTPRTEHLIDLALEEDAGLGDITSRAIFPPGHRSVAVIDAKQELVVCGLEVAARVFAKQDERLKLKLLARDGDRSKRVKAWREWWEEASKELLGKAKPRSKS